MHGQIILASGNGPVLLGYWSLKCAIRWNNISPTAVVKEATLSSLQVGIGQHCSEFIINKLGLLPPLHLREIIALNARLLLSSLAFIESIDRHSHALFFYLFLSLSLLFLSHTLIHTYR